MNKRISLKLTRVTLSLVLALAPLVALTARRSSTAAPSPDSSGSFVTFTQVADSSMAIPDGTGTFMNFPYAPAIYAGNVAFLGTGASGQQGVYFRTTPVDPCRLKQTAVQY